MKTATLTGLSWMQNAFYLGSTYCICLKKQNLPKNFGLWIPWKISRLWRQLRRWGMSEPCHWAARINLTSPRRDAAIAGRLTASPLDKRRDRGFSNGENSHENCWQKGMRHDLKMNLIHPMMGTRLGTLGIQNLGSSPIERLVQPWLFRWFMDIYGAFSTIDPMVDYGYLRRPSYSWCPVFQSKLGIIGWWS